MHLHRPVSPHRPRGLRCCHPTFSRELTSTLGYPLRPNLASHTNIFTAASARAINYHFRCGIPLKFPHIALWLRTKTSLSSHGHRYTEFALVNTHCFALSVTSLPRVARWSAGLHFCFENLFSKPYLSALQMTPACITD